VVFFFFFFLGNLEKQTNKQSERFLGPLKCFQHRTASFPRHSSKPIGSIVQILVTSMRSHATNSSPLIAETNEFAAHLCPSVQKSDWPFGAPTLICGPFLVAFCKGTWSMHFGWLESMHIPLLMLSSCFFIVELVIQ
jgi:hypothetical protein